MQRQSEAQEIWQNPLRPTFLSPMCSALCVCRRFESTHQESPASPCPPHLTVLPFPSSLLPSLTFYPSFPCFALLTQMELESDCRIQTLLISGSCLLAAGLAWHQTNTKQARQTPNGALRPQMFLVSLLLKSQKQKQRPQQHRTNIRSSWSWAGLVTHLPYFPPSSFLPPFHNSYRELLAVHTEDTEESNPG